MLNVVGFQNQGVATHLVHPGNGQGGGFKNSGARSMRIRSAAVRSISLRVVLSIRHTASDLFGEFRQIADPVRFANFRVALLSFQ